MRKIKFIFFCALIQFALVSCGNYNSIKFVKENKSISEKVERSIRNENKKPKDLFNEEDLAISVKENEKDFLESDKVFEIVQVENRNQPDIILEQYLNKDIIIETEVVLLEKQSYNRNPEAINTRVHSTFWIVFGTIGLVLLLLLIVLGGQLIAYMLSFGVGELVALIAMFIFNYIGGVFVTHLFFLLYQRHGIDNRKRRLLITFLAPILLLVIMFFFFFSWFF